jgi:hypothetical protein
VEDGISSQTEESRKLRCEVFSDDRPDGRVSSSSRPAALQPRSSTPQLDAMPRTSKVQAAGVNSCRVRPLKHLGVSGSVLYGIVHLRESGLRGAGRVRRTYPSLLRHRASPSSFASCAPSLIHPLLTVRSVRDFIYGKISLMLYVCKILRKMKM